MSGDETRDLLAQNNARTRGTGPEWKGFGDDDERQVKTPAIAPTAPVRPHWNSVDEAVLWGMDTGAFKAIQHSQNAYDKLKREAVESDNPPTGTKDMFNRWHADVLLRLDRAKAATITDAELDGTDTDPVTAGDYEDPPQF